MLNIVKNHKKTNAKEPAAVPSALAFAGSVSRASFAVLMNAPTRNKEIPWITKEMSNDFLRPRRSITKDAAAVPKMPRVLMRPASQLDL